MISLIAAGGSGSRMAPSTKFINKHLISVGYGELMIDMPLKFLASHQISEVHIVTGSNHASQICEYVGDGESYGFKRVEYSFQPRPLGIADVLKRVSHKNTDEGVLMILGDNYFSHCQDAISNITGKKAVAFEYNIGNIEKAKSFGQVVRKDQVPFSIVEKPKVPQHSFILTGLYYFPSDVFSFVDSLEPSARGELEVTDLLCRYLESGKLDVERVRGQWSDLGEQDSWAGFVASRFNIKPQ